MSTTACRADVVVVVAVVVGLMHDEAVVAAAGAKACAVEVRATNTTRRERDFATILFD